MRRWIAALAVLFSVNASAFEHPAFPESRGGVRELRAGAICYGGISLAIYMYGTVRELHHLALASAALECDADGDPAVCGAVTQGSAFQALPESAKPYYVALVDLWQHDAKNVRTHVIVDVISGTSAGGINGIFLAKALAHNLPIDGLRSIWFEQADIAKLATGRPWWASAFWQLIRKRPALGGDTWLNELNKALDGMDHAPSMPALPSLLAPGQQLDLVVPATDFYGTERLVEVGNPATVSDLRYDHAFRFGARRNADGSVTPLDPRTPDFSGYMGLPKCNGENAGLAFAARASASFPVAFPAINVDELKTALHNPNLQTAKLADQFFGERTVDSGADAAAFAAHLYLVDGGVLDNYPFDVACRQVSRRSPVVETRRVFMYLEPDPRVPRTSDEFNKQGAPDAIQMLLGAKSGIPSAEPIANDLIAIHQHNERVQRVTDIIRNDEKDTREKWGQPDAGTTVAAHVQESTETLKPAELRERLTGLDDDARRRALQEVRDNIESQAAKSGSPLAEEAYIRLRVHSVLDQMSRVMGQAICGFSEDYEGPRTALMREIVDQWAIEQKIKARDTDREPQIDTERRARFLQAFDIGYVRRKLRFVNDWLNEQYSADSPYHLSREQLQKAQGAVSRRVDELSDCIRGNCVKHLHLEEKIGRVHAVVCGVKVEKPREQAAEILAKHGDDINGLESALETKLNDFQEGVLAELYRDFISQTADWNNDAAARAVLARYLGFPYFDRAAYPYTAFSGVGDLSIIEIIRLSPNDTEKVSTKRAGKLSGKGLGHFGAFLTPDGREKDYVWGRLDGAERLLDVLKINDGDARLFTLLHAILDEEKKDAVVKTKNLQVLQDCVAKPGSCS